MTKELIVILGSPGSGKSEVSDLILSYFNGAADGVSWKKIAAENNIDTDTVDDVGRSIIAKKMRESILNSEKDKQIIFGFGLRDSEAQEIVSWLSDGTIKLGCVAEINCSLSHILYKNENCDISSIRNDYLLWHKNKRSVKNILNRKASSFFDINGNSDAIEIAAKLISNYTARKKSVHLYKRVAETNLRTKFGVFRLIAYQSNVDYSYHLCLVKGNIFNKSSVLCRLHSSCITGDIFHSMHCDCGRQLDLALEKISRNENGFLIYMFQEGRGINIINKIKAYDLQWRGFDTVDANLELGLSDEMRTYEVAADIIDDLGVGSIVLMTNNPDKYNKLSDLGVPVEGTISHNTESNGFDLNYLRSKQERMNHNMGLKIIVGTLSDAKNKYVKDIFKDIIDVDCIVSKDVSSSVSDQPFGDEVEIGAKNRALAAFESEDSIAKKIGIGLEGGLIDLEGDLYMTCVSALYDGNDYIVGRSEMIKLPKSVALIVKSGGQFGEAIRRYVPSDDEKLQINELISREESFKSSLKQILNLFIK